MVVTISGGIFNFSDSSYSAPTSSGSIYNFVSPLTGAIQLCLDSTYIYYIHSGGLNIHEVAGELEYANITATDFTTVACNDDYLYLGTTSSGLKRVNKTCISGNIDSPYNLVNCLYDYVTYPYIEDSIITYTHANGEYLGLITNSGTELKAGRIYNQGYVSTATISGAIEFRKCYITSDGLLYYTVNISGTGWSVDRANSVVNWTAAAKSYTTGGSILEPGIIPTDIYVTEGTASDGIGNTLFIATTSGAYVIDEPTDTFITYYTGSGTVSGTSHYILYDVNNTIAIWSDAATNLAAGKLYISTASSLHILDNTQNNIYDYYSDTVPGRTNETLDTTDIVDIGVSYGV